MDALNDCVKSKNVKIQVLKSGNIWSVEVVNVSARPC